MADTRRLAYLDGIRGVAICAVLALHWLSWYSPLFHGGSIGVDVFFVLSGFVITTILWRSAVTEPLAAWGAFVRRRIVRLYPALLGLVAATALLYAVTPQAPVTVSTVSQRGLLVLAQLSSVRAASASTGDLGMPSLNPFGQTWSLAIEWYFYLLWPAVVLLARSRGVAPRRLATAGLAVAAALYVTSLPLSDGWFYFGPAARFSELLAGAVLALWLLAPGPPPAPWPHATAVSVAALAAVAAYCTFAPHAFTPLYRFVGVPVAVAATIALIRVGYVDRRGPVHRLLSHPWPATLGRYSYSLYLWHMVPLLLLETRWLALPKPVLGALAVLGAALLTVLSHRWLERPFLQARSDVLRPLPVRPQHAEARERGDEVVG